MLQRLRNSQENEKGFTLIELLVVILIIAILAAIAIPVFLRQRERGYVAQNESALKNAATAMESYATANDGTWTTAVADLKTEGFRDVANVALTDPIDVTQGVSYCLVATNDKLDATHESAIMTWYSETGRPTNNDTCVAPPPA